jgi:hypothetical protein
MGPGWTVALERQMRNFQNSLLILRKNKMEDNLNVGK